MTKELYVVYFESMNYAGAGETCLVWAESEEDAMSCDELLEHAETFYREQDEDQWREEYSEEMDEEDVIWASIQWAKPLKGSEYEEYQKDPSQAEFYQIVN